jgi:hypothetical protein
VTTVLQTLLVAPAQLGNVDVAVYATPTQQTAKIGRAVFTNTGSGAVQVTAGITTGGALTAGTTLISARTIAPGESYVSPELSGAVILAGSKLHAYASAAAAITFIASGLLIQ